MRVWDVHPGYLSRGNLLGQHAEIHALVSILRDNKKGYRFHPETIRWKGHLDKLRLKHDLTIKEMQLRGYRHASPCVSGMDGQDFAKNLTYVDHPAEQFEILRSKYRGSPNPTRIPLPLRGSDFWAYHKYSVMARGYRFYKEIQSCLKQKKPLPIKEERGFIEKILEIMEKPVHRKALVNVAHHLWGYFKKEASVAEKEHHLYLITEQAPLLLDYFYLLARKYDQKYLLQSTVFAEPFEELI